MSAGLREVVLYSFEKMQSDACPGFSYLCIGDPTSYVCPPENLFLNGASKPKFEAMIGATGQFCPIEAQAISTHHRSSAKVVARR